MNDHALFRPVLKTFAVFLLLQFFSGALLFYLKIGFHPASALEFYVGSEIMRKTYPERPDRFKRSRTFQGLVKSSLGHVLAYGVIAFILAHFLRSLGARADHQGAPSLYNFWGELLFLFALLDILSGFAVRYGPSWLVFARIFVFTCFTLLGIAGALALFRLSAGRSEAKEWPSTRP